MFDVQIEKREVLVLDSYKGAGNGAYSPRPAKVGVGACYSNSRADAGLINMLWL